MSIPTEKGNKSTKNRSKKRVLMALSGGIDSAVSAWKLIQAGYEVEAAFMKNYSATKGLKYDECPWLQDRQDALRVAAFLGIPMHTVNYEKEYEKNVLDYFFKEYKAGRTPNPDVMCNKEIKFKMLYNWAMKNGFDYVATGHYAQVQRVSGSAAKKGFATQPVDNFFKKTVGKWTSSDKVSAKAARLAANASEDGSDYRLMRSADDFKDQTYFIYNIRTPQLPHLIFPIGGMKKSEVKALAKKIGLPNADKKESMGLCFVGKIRLKEFLDQKLKPKPGKIVVASNTKAVSSVVGEHQGLAYYTIGQRQGVRVGAGGPWYVVRKDLKKNELVVTNDPHDKLLETQEVELHSVNFITTPLSLISKKIDANARGKTQKLEAKLQGRFRHQGALVPLTISALGPDHYLVKFKKPQQAIASGQSLVLYDGKICVGGGVIV
jgi:tRNA-specific 2-thiouridylase